MSDGREFQQLTQQEMIIIDRLCDRIEGQWRRGTQITVEELLPELPEQLRSQALRELIAVEIACRLAAEVPVSLSELLQRFPDMPSSLLAESLEEAQGDSTTSGRTTEFLPREWGKFQLLRPLGMGGMGTVWLAERLTSGEQVAVKLLRADSAGQGELRRRFSRELQTATKLQHPNIVRALEEVVDDGQLGLIMEFVRGDNLEQAVVHRGPLPVDETLKILSQVSAGLQYAHDLGIVHRDIKPANLLRDEAGVVKILDMGLARLTTPDEHMSLLTRTGMVMGTAAYMSPEQARDPRDVDSRSDWYSLGCTLFFLLTGKAPYRGANPIQLALAHSQEPVPTVRDLRPDVPENLDRLIQLLLAKQPQHRPASAAEVMRILQGVANEAEALPLAERLQQLDLRPLPHELRRKRHPRTIPTRAIMLVAMALALVFTVGWYALKGDSSPVEPHQVSPIVGNQPAEPPSPNPTPSVQIMQFNGTDSYLHIPVLTPEAGTAYTIEAIAKPEAFQTANVVTWLGPDWMAIYLTADGHWGVARRWGEAQQIRTSLEPASLNEWVSLTGVFDRNEMKLYVNGVRQSGPLTDYPLPETQGGLYLGGVDPQRIPDRFFRGQIRSMRISRGVRQIESGELTNLHSTDSLTLFKLAPPEVYPANTEPQLHAVRLREE